MSLFAVLFLVSVVSLFSGQFAAGESAAAAAAAPVVVSPRLSVTFNESVWVCSAMQLSLICGFSNFILLFRYWFCAR